MDAIYAYLKEHDPEWLQTALLNRVRHLKESRGDNDNKLDQRAAADADLLLRQAARSDMPVLLSSATGVSYDTSACGPWDVTVAELNPRVELSDYVKYLRAYDWGSTPLGPMAQWSTAFRRYVNFLLKDTRAAALWWGTDLIGIYNEPYSHVAAHRHPAALGSSVHKVWPELVDLPFGQSFELANRTGKASYGDNGVFYVERGGYLEEVWANWIMIPIPGPGGNLGCYNAATEVTTEVLHDRRMKTLSAIDSALADVSAMKNYWAEVLLGLEDNPHEAPFAVVYGPMSNVTGARPVRTISSDGTKNDDIDDMSSVSDYSSIFAGCEWQLEGQLIRNDLDPALLPPTVDLESGSDLLCPAFRAAMNTKTVMTVDMAGMGPALSRVAKSRAHEHGICQSALIIPIWSNYQEHRSGFLLLGLNPRRTYDIEYQRFIRMLHTHLTTSLSTLVLAEDEAKRARLAARTAAKDRIRLVEKLAETKQEAEISEMRFRSMADLAPIGVFEMSVRGDLLYANQRWIELTGYSPETSQEGNPISNALVEADREAFAEHWTRLLSGEEVHFECRLDRPYLTDEIYAGERMCGETWILVAAYALRDDTLEAGIRGLFGCFADISRVKWVESWQERRAMEQAERRRQQENFMDSTSHEARNPLAAITLCADDINTTVRDLVRQASGQEQHVSLDLGTATAILESAETIVACASHQKRIIDDVLTLSKLDSGMLTTSPTPIRPTEVIDQALRMFRSEIKRSDVELVYTVDKSYTDCKVAYVMLDPTRFLQVLVNLLNNAIKFTKQEQSRKIAVTLEASYMRPNGDECGVQFAESQQRRESLVPALSPSEEISSPVGNVYLFVSIRDTGRGIIQSELDNLFQRFQQASPKTYAQYGGSGLGLWISKELCAKLGGQIGVASQAGSNADRGSTFAFYVQAPRCEPPTVREDRDTALTERKVAEEVQHALGLSETLNTGNSTPVLGTLQDPLVPPSVDSMSTTPPAVSGDTGKLSVLVCEDNLVNQKVMRKQLIRAGFDVAVANHGKEALDLIYASVDGLDTSSSGAAFDVVLMDIEMPIMGGLECTQIIRMREKQGHESAQEHRVPILGVTANARAEQQSAALNAGMDMVVTKPFHMTDLLPAIESIRKGRP